LWQTFEIKKHRLLVFPSGQAHGFSGPPQENIRVSLSFNTWFADNHWGNRDNLTEVKY
jgi:hypothetical protein